MKRTYRWVIAGCAVVIRECVRACNNGRARKYFGLAIFMVSLLTGMSGQVKAASSRFCEGGGWVLTEKGKTMLVRGRHVQFDIDLRTGGVRNWTLTGALNTGRLVERPTMIFSEKTPLHGAVLMQTDRLRNDRGDLIFIRTNGVVEVKIQAKDCSQGGIFQMEIERDDAPSTRVRHVLAPETFYFDNPNFDGWGK